MLSPYSSPRPAWEAAGALFLFDREVINISGNDSMMSSDLDNSLFTMNQLILYTNGGVKELGNIVGIHTEGKGAHPLFTINPSRGERSPIGGHFFYHCQQEVQQRRQPVNN